MLIDRHATREDGFTLVELLVAAGASIVLLFALTALLTTVLHSTQTANARVSATRGTRLALAGLENELHSACVGTGSTQNLAPIEPNSDGTTLQFVNYTGTAINPTPVWHVVRLTGTTLTDTTYSVAGSVGNWTQGSKQATTTLLVNVVAQGTTPVFRYFAYASTPAPDGQAYWTIPDGSDSYPNGLTPSAAPLAVPLTAATAGTAGTAATAVEVLVTLQGGPSGTSAGSATDTTVADPETDAISLRLTSPPDEAPATDTGDYGPCQ